MNPRFAFVPLIVLLSACARDFEARTPKGEQLVAIDAPAGATRWEGLLKPVALRVDPDGLVLVADEADSKIRVFDADGIAKGEIGGAGAGPGEFARIRDLAPGHGVIRVFDGVAGRFHSVSSDGAYLGTHTIEGVGDEAISALGDSSIVLASSARWSLAPRAGAPAWPLARVLVADGTARYDIGERTVVKSPFAAHIRNFVLPAGSADGRFVWLAFLNAPEVLLITTADRVVRSVPRSLPFEWVQIPDDFMPSAAPGAGRGDVLPFDVVSYGVATDSAGRAFVLTALESSREQRGRPQHMGIDVLAPEETSVRRLEVTGHYTHIAVAPDGGRIYLLDSSTGQLRVFQGPR